LFLINSSSDAFSKREKAAEDLAIRQRETEKLRELSAKLKENQKHMAQLQKDM
jgi:hypothetical protein